VTDGLQGEDNDYFANHCDGVTATINPLTNNGATAGDYVTLGGLTTAETALLKACLGDSDGNAADNVEVYNWDYGDINHPHLIKLVRTVTNYQDGGYYAALYWNTTVGFKLLHPFVPPDNSATDSYDIYTTQGILEVTSTYASALFPYGSHWIATTVTSQADAGAAYANLFSGDLACESPATSQPTYLMNCVNKTDLITVLSFAAPAANPPYINLYTAKRVWTTPYQFSVGDQALYTGGVINNALQELKRGTHVIETDLALNWGADDTAAQFLVYKFVPAMSSTYNYVAPCSNRGICDTSSGLCTCFPGYTSDSCAVQNSLAL